MVTDQLELDSLCVPSTRPLWSHTVLGTRPGANPSGSTVRRPGGRGTLWVSCLLPVTDHSFLDLSQDALRWRERATVLREERIRRKPHSGASR